MSKTFLNVLAVILGLGFIALAVLYWTTPAGNLPAYIPGFSSGSTAIHFKHGLASLLLGLATFAYVWFGSGKKGVSA